MLLVDSRVGSKELLTQLRGFGVDARLVSELDSDFEFIGNDRTGIINIGVERKTVQDLINSMRSRRLAGLQIGRMQLTYARVYLVVEGIWRRGESGLLEQQRWDIRCKKYAWFPVRGNVHYSEVTRFLCSLEELGGVRVCRTANERETCAVIADRYMWWQKPYNAHKTGMTLYANELRLSRRERQKTMFGYKPNLMQRWAAQLTGVDNKAWEIGKGKKCKRRGNEKPGVFSSGREMANASVEDWMRVKGIGKKTAENIVKEITEEL